MSPCRWALLDALDQSHFEGLEGPAGAIGHGGVLPGQLGGAIREQAAEVPGVARGSVRDSQDVRTQSRVGPVVGPSERPPRRLGHLGAVPIENPQVELALVAEGAVEAALAQSGRRRDLVDAGAGEPGGPEPVTSAPKHRRLVKTAGSGHLGHATPFLTKQSRNR